MVIVLRGNLNPHVYRNVELCATKMSTTLPNELMDRIIDHFHDDPQTQSACGLVCSGWTPSVRYHRFQDVYLEKDAIPAFHRLLKGLSRGGVARVQYVHRLLLPRRPRHDRAL